MSVPEQEQKEKAYNSVFSLNPLSEYEFKYGEEVLTFKALGVYRNKLTYFIFYNDKTHYVEFEPDYLLINWYNFIDSFLIERFRKYLEVNSSIPPFEL
jgi:hypothetical protein